MRFWNNKNCKPDTTEEREGREGSETEGGQDSKIPIYEPILYKKVIAWFLLQMLYTFLGGLLFLLLEECYGIDEMPNTNYEGLISYIENKMDFPEDEKIKFKNISKQYFQSLVKARKCAMDHDLVAKWWSFTIITCYTIGKIHPSIYSFATLKKNFSLYPLIFLEHT